MRDAVEGLASIVGETNTGSLTSPLYQIPHGGSIPPSATRKMADYQCPYEKENGEKCGWEAEKPESVAGHMLSKHAVNSFDDLSEVEKEDLSEEVIEKIKGAF